MTRASGKFGSFALPGDGTERGSASALIGTLAASPSRLGPVDLVRAHVTASIAFGFPSPGERLPSPEALAESLNVSPITVRRALESMCRDGLLERRRGRSGGTFVSADPVPSHAAGTTGQQDVLAALRTAAEQRLVIESGVITLVAAVAPEPQTLRAVLTATVDDTGATGPTRAVAIEASFHGHLAALTGLPGATQQVQDAVLNLAGFLLSPHRTPTALITQEHEAIIDALIDTDGARAARLMRDHLDHLHHLPPEPAPRAELVLE